MKKVVWKDMLQVKMESYSSRIKVDEKDKSENPATIQLFDIFLGKMNYEQVEVLRQALTGEEEIGNEIAKDILEKINRAFGRCS